MTARGAAGSVEISVDAPPAVTVLADPDRLRQVIAGLVDNAIRHTPAGGRISLAARSADGWATLTVADTGPGIAAEDLPHIFERFYQADDARDRGTGTSGLGLAIVRALVDAQGGQVAAGRAPGGGASFEVRLAMPVA
jgi:two-component system sensor histidine kinase BaeS